MEIVPMKISPNEDAVSMLKETLKRVEDGEIQAVGIAWTTQDGDIGGEISIGKNNLLMWAAFEHTARTFYADIILKR